MHECQMCHNINKVVDSLLHVIMSVLRPYDIHTRTVSDQGGGYHQSDALLIGVSLAKDTRTQPKR